MSDDIANLGFKVDTADLKRAADQLDKLDASGKKVKTTFKTSGSAVEQALGGINNKSSATAQALGQVSKSGSATAKALGTIRKSSSATSKALGAVGLSGLSVNSMLSDMRGLLAGVGLAAAVKGYINLSDSYKSMNAGLEVVSASQRELNTAQQDLIGIAQSSRSPLEDVFSLYIGMAPAMREMGLAQADMSRTTELVTKSLKIGGGTAVEHSNALRQIIQALGSGVLRGDEFNTTMESGRGFALQLAEGLGVPISALRDMAEAGELTADIVVSALLRQEDAINKTFDGLPKTAGQAWALVKNEALLAIGAIDEKLGASEGWAEFLTSLSESVKIFADVTVVAVEHMGIVVTAVMSKLIAASKAYVISKLDEIAIDKAAAAAGAQTAAARASAAQAVIAAEKTKAASLAASAAAEAISQKAALKSAQTWLIASKGTDSYAAALARVRNIAATVAPAVTKARVAQEASAAATAKLTLATNASAAAQGRLATATAGLTIASRVGATAVGALGSAITFLGGPLGVIAIAAYAIYSYREEITEAVTQTGQYTKAARIQTKAVEEATKIAYAYAEATDEVKKALKEKAVVALKDAELELQTLTIRSKGLEMLLEQAKAQDIINNNTPGGHVASGSHELQTELANTTKLLDGQSKVVEALKNALDDLGKSTEELDGAQKRHGGTVDDLTASILAAQNAHEDSVSALVSETNAYNAGGQVLKDYLRELEIEKLMLGDVKDETDDLTRSKAEEYLLDLEKNQAAKDGNKLREKQAEHLADLARAQKLHNIEMTQGADAAYEESLVMEGLDRSVAQYTVTTEAAMHMQAEFKDALYDSIMQADSIKDAFSNLGDWMKNWLKQQIAHFAANKIMVGLGGLANGGGAIGSALGLLGFGGGSSPAINGAASGAANGAHVGANLAPAGATAWGAAAAASFQAALGVGAVYAGGLIAEGLVNHMGGNGEAAKIGAWIGGAIGGTLGAQLGGLVGGIFGGKEKATSSGISVGYSGGQVVGQNYTNYKTEGGLFHSDDKRVETSDLNAGIEIMLSDYFSSLNATIVEQAENLGIDGADAILDSFSVATQKFSGDDAAEELAAWLEEATRSAYQDAYQDLGPEIKGYLDETIDLTTASVEEIAATFEGLSVIADTLVPMFEGVGLQLGGTLDEATASVARLAEEMGGMDALTAQMGLFFAEFVPESVKAKTALDQATQSVYEWNAEIGNGGQYLTSTSSGLASFMTGLDATSASTMQTGLLLNEFATSTANAEGKLSLNVLALNAYARGLDTSTEAGMQAFDAAIALSQAYSGGAVEVTTTQAAIDAYTGALDISTAAGQAAAEAVSQYGLYVSEADGSLRLSLSTFEDYLVGLDRSTEAGEAAYQSAIAFTEALGLGQISIDGATTGLAAYIQGLDLSTSAGTTALTQIQAFATGVDASTGALVINRDALDTYIASLNTNTQAGAAAYASAMQLSESLGAVDNSAITTREGMYEYIAGLDLTTQAGREAAAVALQQLEAIIAVDDARQAAIGTMHGVNEAMAMMNIRFDETSPSAIAVSNAMVALMGGMDAFTAKTQSYYENFYTAQEQANMQLATAAGEVDAFNESLIDAGGAAVETKDEFRQYVEGLDTTTEAGALAYAQAMEVADSFAAITEGGVGVTEALENLPTEVQDTFELAKANMITSLGDMAASWGEMISGVTDGSGVVAEAYAAVNQAAEEAAPKILATGEGITEAATAYETATITTVTSLEGLSLKTGEIGVGMVALTEQIDLSVVSQASLNELYIAHNELLVQQSTLLLALNETYLLSNEALQIASELQAQSLANYTLLNEQITLNVEAQTRQLEQYALVNAQLVVTEEITLRKIINETLINELMLTQEQLTLRKIEQFGIVNESMIAQEILVLKQIENYTALNEYLTINNEIYAQTIETLPVLNEGLALFVEGLALANTQITEGAVLMTESLTILGETMTLATTQIIEANTLTAESYTLLVAANQAFIETQALYGQTMTDTTAVVAASNVTMGESMTLLGTTIIAASVLVNAGTTAANDSMNLMSVTMTTGAGAISAASSEAQGAMAAFAGAMQSVAAAASSAAGIAAAGAHSAGVSARAADGFASAASGFASAASGFASSADSSSREASSRLSSISVSVDGSHAGGLDYVPFDGYIAELHKGERVVPAAEASLARGNRTQVNANRNSSSDAELKAIRKELQESRKEMAAMRKENNQLLAAIASGTNQQTDVLKDSVRSNKRLARKAASTAA